jgi:hypothetical protein
MNRFRLAAGVACAALLAACTNDVTLTNAQPGLPQSFLQIEVEGRNLAINLFTPWSDHVSINKADIGPGGKIISTDIATFMTSTAGRSSAITLQVQSMLTPSILVADFSQTSNASYLGIETAGKLNLNGTVCTGSVGVPPCTGGLFGGRGLTDDLGSDMLGLAFGSLVPQLYPTIPDDGKEQNGTNGTANLANDNVPAPTSPGVAFPYLAPPH